MKKKITVVLIVILAGIQFIRIDQTNPEAKPGNDFLAISKAPENIQAIIRASCYDCHSNNKIPLVF